MGTALDSPIRHQCCMREGLHHHLADLLPLIITRLMATDVSMMLHLPDINVVDTKMTGVVVLLNNVTVTETQAERGKIIGVQEIVKGGGIRTM